MPSDTIKIGFLPLTDCAALAIAQEKGFFSKRGVRVELRKAQSWGQVQDKLQAGEVDLTHMLITMPLQLRRGNGRFFDPVCYAFVLSQNGNGIIISNALWNDGVHDAAGLSSWLDEGRERVARFGVVFPRGSQEYFLRNWLAQAGLEIGARINLTSIAPQELVGRLRKGEIDGYCVAEPWSRRAAVSKLGRLVAQSGDKIPGLGEKVLAAKCGWHASHAAEHRSIVQALLDATDWMADPAHWQETAELVASKKYVNTPISMVDGALREHPDAEGRSSNPGGTRLFGKGVNFPARGHAAWYLEQMRRWSHHVNEPLNAASLEKICLEKFFADSARA